MAEESGGIAIAEDNVNKLVNESVQASHLQNEGLNKLLLWKAARDGRKRDVQHYLWSGAAVDYQHESFGTTPLHVASRGGHVETVKVLLGHKANPNTLDEFCTTPLLEASRSGHVETVEVLLAYNANPNTCDEFGTTPLHEASGGGHVEAVKLLLAHKANLNTRDKRGITPLHEASEGGHVETVEVLLAYKANPDTPDNKGNTALHKVSRHGHVETVEALLAYKANPNTLNGSGTTPLHEASHSGHVETVEVLLAHKANPSTPDKNGTTPLHNASRRGRVQIVEVLLAHRANPNMPDIKGITPLHKASRGGHVETVVVLLAHEANPNTPNKTGDTPLHEASRGGHVETVGVLLAHKANPNTLKDNGETPLHCAKSVAVADLLVKYGASLTAVKNSGDSVLLTACGKYGHDIALIRYFVERGLDFNARNKTGTTPLHVTSQGGHVRTVKMLLEHKANLNIPDKIGKTPLHLAGNEAVAECLLSHGADIHRLSNDDDTALHCACIQGRKDVVLYLVEQGLSLESINKELQTPIDILKQAGVDWLMSDRASCLHLLHSKGYYKGDIGSGHSIISTVGKEVREAKGEMKVARVLLHGAPQSGKSSAMRLILDEPPIQQDSTKLVKDPIRAISTNKWVKMRGTSLKQMNEETLINMIQTVVRNNRRTHQTPSPTNPKPSPTTNFPHSIISPPNSSKPKWARSKVMRKVASDLNSIAPDSPSLFDCHHIHLVDSGGQPQFSNLLPLLYQSQLHHHIVVIRLDQKLHDKPQNCYRVNGSMQVIPESLVLTSYQLIERVCQMANGSDSQVIVIGTHLDQENSEEPLAMKNKMLKPLMEKHKFNFLPTKDGQPIFAVNAMAHVGDERHMYSQTLQDVLLQAPVLVDEGESVQGLSVPLRWIVLELELSLRSKEVGGVLEMEEVKEIAKLLEVDNLQDALQFFNKLGLHYHYPDALPNKIFTSIAPISSLLSKIVEATFPVQTSSIMHQDRLTLQETGELSRKYLEMLFPSEQNTKESLSLDDFTNLLRHYRVLIDVDEDAYLIPSLLPVNAPALNIGKCHEPLLCYWLHQNDKVRILPQSFFHALIVELRSRTGISLIKNDCHSRSSFLFNVALSPDRTCHLKLTDGLFWLEVSITINATREDCRFILENIQVSTKRVLTQLKLTSLYDLQYGLRCYSPECRVAYPHPCKCIDHSQFMFSCVEKVLTWSERDEIKLYWFKVYDTSATSPDSSPSSIIKQFTCPLLDAIADPDRLATDMFVNDMISSHFKDSVITSPHDRYQKTNRLLTELYRCSKDSLVGNDVLQKLCIILRMQRNPLIDSIISEIEKAAGLRTASAEEFRSSNSDYCCTPPRAEAQPTTHHICCIVL